MHVLCLGSFVIYCAENRFMLVYLSKGDVSLASCQPALPNEHWVIAVDCDG